MTESLINDPRYVQGKQLLKDKKFEEAIEFLSEMLRVSCEQFGDKSLVVAPLWFEYGNALLAKEEDNPSNNLLGTAANEAKKAVQMLGSEEQAEGDEEEGEEPSDEPGVASMTEGKEGEGEGGEGAEALAEEEEDIQMAWEALEVRRPAVCAVMFF